MCSPLPTVSWYKDEMLLISSENREFESANQTLYLYDVSLADQGRYKCQGSNKLGTVTNEFTIVVQG